MSGAVERPKSRLLIALLGLLAPGLGQVFVGHTARGFAWVIVPFVACIGFLLAAHEPSTTTLFAAFGIILALAWAGSLLDALLIPVARHRAISIPAVVVFAVFPVILAPAFAILLRVFVVEAFRVPSGAMIPSIAIGDHFFVDKLVYNGRAPRRGEIVVFRYPEHPEQDFVKRAVAVAGDKLDVRGGHPFINGWEVPSCRVGDWQFTETEDQTRTEHHGPVFVEFLEASAYLVFFDTNALNADYQGPYLVAPGETFVMGDNRNNSHDSRAWFGGRGGGVPAALVKGRARLVWMSQGASHQGVDLAKDPVAPSPSLAAALAACLAKRPSIADATPPPAH